MKNIKSRNTEKEETYKVKKKTLDLLPDADNNIAKLQAGLYLYSLRILHEKDIFSSPSKSLSV